MALVMTMENKWWWRKQKKQQREWKRQNGRKRLLQKHCRVVGSFFFVVEWLVVVMVAWTKNHFEDIKAYERAIWGLCHWNKKKKQMDKETKRDREIEREWAPSTIIWIFLSVYFVSWRVLIVEEKYINRATMNIVLGIRWPFVPNK